MVAGVPVQFNADGLDVSGAERLKGDLEDGFCRASQRYHDYFLLRLLRAERLRELFGKVVQKYWRHLGQHVAETNDGNEACPLHRQSFCLNKDIAFWPVGQKAIFAFGLALAS